MTLVDDVKKNAVTGLFIGIGAAIIAPVLMPILASIGRPLAKGAVKGGLMVYEKGREKFAEAGELLEDLVAEARVEMTQEQGGAGVGSAQEAGNGAEMGAASSFEKDPQPMAEEAVKAGEEEEQGAAEEAAG